MKAPFNTARSLRHVGAVTLILAASAVQACSSDAISTGPVSVSRSGPTTPAAIQLLVTGTVTDDEGTPVSGARVILYRWMVSENPHTAVTDNAGLYSISFLSAPG